MAPSHDQCPPSRACPRARGVLAWEPHFAGAWRFPRGLREPLSPGWAQVKPWCASPRAAVVRVTRAPVPQGKLLRPPPRTTVISLDSARGPGRPLVANGPGRRGHREGLASVRAWTLAPALPRLREGRAPGEGSWASLWGGGTGVSLRRCSPVSPTSSQRPEPHFPEKRRPRGHVPPAPRPATGGGDSVQVVPTVPDSQPQPATLPGECHTLGLTPRGSAGPRRGEGPSPPQASLPGALPWGQPALREGDKGG